MSRLTNRNLDMMRKLPDFVKIKPRDTIRINIKKTLLWLNEKILVDLNNEKILQAEKQKKTIVNIPDTTPSKKEDITPKETVDEYTKFLNNTDKLEMKISHVDTRLELLDMILTKEH